MVGQKPLKVPDFKPFGFIIDIEILDDKQEPVPKVTFSIAVDNENPQTRETNDDGALKVSKPKSEINLTYAASE